MIRYRFVLYSVLLFITPVTAEPQCFKSNGNESNIHFDFAIERSEFSGHFSDFEVRYCWQDNTPRKGRIEVKVDMTSVKTGNKDLDIGMRDKEALNINEYPVATWQTESIVKVGNHYRAQGELTIRGISHQKSGEFKLMKTDYGWNLKGSSDLQRLNYDLGIGEFADTDFIPNTVTVHYDFKLKPLD